MSKNWAEHTAEEKKNVYESLAKVYAEAGHPKQLKNPTQTAEYVNILMANQKQEAVRPLAITGEFGPDDEQIVNDITPKIKECLANVKDAKVSISTKRGVGASMGVIKSVNKLDGTECDVTHEQGQVLLLDFWATWCPPCQGPMAHNQKMLEEHGEKWGGKVRLIGLSIDQTAQKVKDHVENKKWTSVEHYHVRNGKCVADKEFGVQGVPHVAIVDTTGKIVFVGHPASRPDLVQDFNDLLEGKTITGKGCTAGGGDDEEDDEEFKQNVEADAVEGAVTKFLADAETHLLTEATKEVATGMPRAFCVLVHES